jgi:hypothetical protein
MNFIPVNEPLLNGNEKKYLNECIDTGWISSEGPFIKRFEKGMANYVGRKYGVACANGSAALDIAVRALDLQKGDEVIAPSFTIISSIQSLVTNGLKPILLDCDFSTFNINPNEIETKITPKTKAIMVVHLYGLTVDMDIVLNIAKKYNLKIIEDSAQMHGQEYKGKKCGSFGVVSIFSFYPNKQITTGEGGYTDEQIIDKILTDEYMDFCNNIGSAIKKQESRFRNPRNSAKIACFTESVQSKYMWDRYADGYKGFALEYDLRKCIFKYNSLGMDVNLFPVIYTELRPDVTLDEGNIHTYEYFKQVGDKNWLNFFNVSAGFVIKI